MTNIINVVSQFPIPRTYPRLAMDAERVGAIAIHHTAVSPFSDANHVALVFPAAQMSDEDELNHIRVIHLYHKSKGFGGFAYHFIAFPSGRVYLVVPLNQWGSHVFAENDHLYGIVVAGDFTDAIPDIPQQVGVVGAIEHIFAYLGRRVPIRSHWAWGGTACPGARRQQWVPYLIDLVDGEEDEDVLTQEDKDFFIKQNENMMSWADKRAAVTRQVITDQATRTIEEVAKIIRNLSA